MIQQLVYISSPRGPVTEEECEAILAISRRNNARAGISGVLVMGKSRFLQLLEGPPHAVAAAFARIKADPRHYAAVVISDRMADQRQCPNWAMGIVRPGARSEAVAALVEQLLEPIEDANLRAQFVGFAELQAA